MNPLLGIRNLARAAADRISAARRRRQTLRLVDSLPPDILKDIGYPGYSDVDNIR